MPRKFRAKGKHDVVDSRLSTDGLPGDIKQQASTPVSTSFYSVRKCRGPVSMCVEHIKGRVEPLNQTSNWNARVAPTKFIDQFN